jgi:hypothetical protein
MKDRSEQLKELDNRLRSVRFQPRASLESEILGRIRRGDTPQPAAPYWPGRIVTAAVVLLLGGGAVGTAVYFYQPSTRVTVDRCCYDLDGGGVNDDGVLVVAKRNSSVHRLQVYEDVDDSRSYTSSDVIRLDRGEKPIMLSSDSSTGVVAIKHCCVDLDGGGPHDDGLVIIGIPPNRILMAAIFETGPSPARGPSPDGWVLR